MKNTKVWLIPAAVLLLFVAGALLAGWLLALQGSRWWILELGLWLLGLLAAGLLFLYLRARARASGAQPVADDEVDRVFAAVRQRLAATRAGGSGKLGRLPAVLVMGPRGSTKTTTLLHSGLEPEHLAGELRRGARRFDQALLYDRRRKISGYAQMMRAWPGFEAPASLKDHVIRYLPRDYELFARLNAGDQYPQAHQHAMTMLAERIKVLRRQGKSVREGSAEYDRLRDSIVPPYDAGKFPNKWRKMWRDQPARTLMAHLGKDSYSHIHYDSAQQRTISVREAARLQSFPDGFIFRGTMNPAFRQIGNAVPPLLAKAVAERMLATLRAAAPGDADVVQRAG